MKESKGHIKMFDKLMMDAVKAARERVEMIDFQMSELARERLELIIGIDKVKEAFLLPDGDAKFFNIEIPEIDFKNETTIISENRNGDLIFIKENASMTEKLKFVLKKSQSILNIGVIMRKLEQLNGVEFNAIDFASVRKNISSLMHNNRKIFSNFGKGDWGLVEWDKKEEANHD